jgi:predicted secreted acid phosphatase
LSGAEYYGKSSNVQLYQINDRETRREKKSTMENPETQATLDTTHKTKMHKIIIKTPHKKLKR